MPSQIQNEVSIPNISLIVSINILNKPTFITSYSNMTNYVHNLFILDSTKVYYPHRYCLHYSSSQMLSSITLLAHLLSCLVLNRITIFIKVLFWLFNQKRNLFFFQVIKIMSISHGDRSVDLPSLNIEHNYPHLLSELVMKL